MSHHLRPTTAPRPDRTATLLAVLLSILAFVVGTPAHAADAPAHFEPKRLVFHPDTEQLEVEVVNDGPAPLRIDGFELTGPERHAFAVAEGGDATTVPPGGRHRIALRVERGAFEAIDEATGRRTGKFREGRARLRVKLREAAGAGSATDQAIGLPLRFEAPSWVSAYLVPAVVKVLVLVMLFVMPLASLLTWLERKQSAMMQDRVGPNMAGVTILGKRIRVWGLLHIAADGLKMLFKEDLVPARVHKALYNLAPFLAFVPALAVFAIVPFGDALCYGQLGEVLSQADVDQCAAGRGGTPLQVAQIDVGLLFYFAIASLASYGTTLAGWASYNKWAMLGGLRASAQMISYEVAIGLSIVGALLCYGTLEPHALVKAQSETYWGIVLQPLGFLLFFAAAMAETKRTPFDLPEGESEIVGYFLEYSGMRFGLFFLGEFVEIVFMSAMVATLFLGGWTLPLDMFGASGFTSPLWAQLFFAGAGALLVLVGVSALRASPHAEIVGIVLTLIGAIHLALSAWSIFTGWGTALPHGLVIVVGMVTWGVKVALLCWLQLLVRWTLPRFRYDQLMKLGWRGLLPLAIANVVLTAVAVYFLMPGKDFLP
ncbi:MAG: NADH-quinone oxidoreductase subunit H [Deltaproteobacteria bacterium]|nr:MAG: NADH-quinone oxidoreductase subunit H [Deltaproteobacteria bacterium]